MTSDLRRLIVDSSYLIAHWNDRDAHHERALEIEDHFMEGRWHDLVLVDAAFAETMNVLQKKKDYAFAKQVGDILRNGDEITWLHLGDRLDAAWNRFLTQPKGTMSLVDCALVAVAEEFRIPEIATFDRAFDTVPGLKRVPHEETNASS